MKKLPIITSESGRYFQTDRIREEVDFRGTRQSPGVRPSPVQKLTSPDSTIIRLSAPETWAIPKCDLQSAISNRENHRRFTTESLTTDELAFLLWSTQGTRQNAGHSTSTGVFPLAGQRSISPESIKQLFKPYPAAIMMACQVSSLVNNPKNDSEDCIAPL